MFLGYLLSTQDIKKKHRIIIYVLAIIGVLFRYISTYILSKQAGEVIKITWSLTNTYASWHSVLLACAVFVFVKNLKIDEKIKQNPKIVGLLKKISSCSFGIYLIHKIVIYYQVKLLNINIESWQWRTIGIVTTYIISLGFIYILKKIPIVKKIVP